MNKDKNILFTPLARRLARTHFGQKALHGPDVRLDLKQKPDVRTYLGLALVALSYLLFVPAMGVVSYLSFAWSKPVIIPLGGIVVFLLVHLIFALGAYLAGKKYAGAVLRWAIQWFLKKYT